ncbi:pyridoxal-phosphate dependent enzyme [Actinoplanes sp. NPDC049118]|uniref:threonine ammonia-lyase n=1 Tax=Actinoplanes sp. NPDC049118 TaxID=3155769 RepID=UPI0033F5CE72
MIAPVRCDLPEVADVRTAADRIAGRLHRTPLLGGPAGLLLKGEHGQHSGSFKIRGALNAVLATGAAEVITGSSGNHGIALATVARGLGVRVTVVAAAGASPAKLALIRELGGRTVSVAGGVVEREAHARELAAAGGAVLIPSSDHPLVIAGQGTVGTEILEDAPSTTTIYVPTGGGGLLAGVCLAVTGRPVRVVGVEPAGIPRYARSLAAGHPVRLAPSDTVADGLRGEQPGRFTYPIIRDHVDDLIAVSDAEIRAAASLLARYGARVEPSGAVAVAGALRAGPGNGDVAILSGGNTAAALSRRTIEHRHLRPAPVS